MNQPVTAPPVTFTALADNEVAPRLAQHLEPGEQVLWQGAADKIPVGEILSLVSAAALILAGAGLLAGLGPLLMPSLAFQDASTLVPASVMIVAGLLFLGLIWNERAANWRYGMTDRRILLVRGSKLFRTGVPAEMHDLKISGSTVYWRREQKNAGSDSSRSYRLIGFKGMADPAAAKQRIEAWRDELEARAEASARQFVEAMQDSAAELPAGVTRIVHPGTGLTIDVPEGWDITVSRDEEGPLSLFGFTLLKRVIRRGPTRPYGSGGAWNVLRVSAGTGGPAGSGLYMMIKNAPLTQTFDSVVNDPWNERMGLEILQTTPELQVGSYRGFSLVRKLPNGGPILGWGQITGEVLTRMIWLGDDSTCVEFTGIARSDQPELHDAVDAMVASLSQQ